MKKYICLLSLIYLISNSANPLMAQDTASDQINLGVITETSSGGRSTALKDPIATTILPADNGSISVPAHASSVILTDKRTFSRIHLTAGPELSLFTLSGANRWSSDLSGLGMSQNIGASLRGDYRFVWPLALSVTGGYAQWEMVRNYLQTGVEKYDETISLVRIPIQGGVKIYAGRNLYLLPEAGINLLVTKVNTSGAHPAPTSQQSRTTPITYAVNLGYEFYAGHLLIDLSARYQVLDVKNMNFGSIAPSLTEKVHLGSVRLGIGFNALRK